MSLIRLTQGHSAIVDDEFVSELSRTKWCYSHGYAQRRRNGKIEYMHRVIMGHPLSEVDHINRNRLDNRCENLRCADRITQCLNASLRSDNKSGYHGIFWNLANQKWRVLLKRNHVRYDVGCFVSLQDAVVARDEYVTRHHLPIHKEIVC